MKDYQIPKEEKTQFISLLKDRFENHMSRHLGMDWKSIQMKLEINDQKLWSLYAMESTGGEPDVVKYDPKLDEYHFYDCAPESPKGRRSLCYDQKALDARKENKPLNSAMRLANEMGIEILNEDEYRYLQQFGTFDNKTSSWLKTPDAIRNLGGAIFGDYRYAQVFIYHNGADSYYGSRGFRASLRV